MKHYIVYQGNSKDLTAGLIRVDGTCIASHVCSDPVYMYGDLWERRPELRKEFPNAVIDRTPYPIAEFKIKFPAIFAEAFVE